MLDIVPLHTPVGPHARKSALLEALVERCRAFPPIRAAVVQDAGWLGLALNEEANLRADLRMDAEDSQAPIWRMAADENRVIARHCARLLAASPHPLPR